MPELYMTAQEYKILRIMSGMTQEEAARFHGCKNVRTIKRWESGKSAVSKFAAEKIAKLNMLIQQSVDQEISSYLSQKEKYGSPEEILLIIYKDTDYAIYKSDMFLNGLSNNVHKAVVSRTYIALKNIGAKVIVIEMDTPDYLSFIKDRGLQNQENESTRAAWACFYLDRMKNKQ